MLKEVTDGFNKDMMEISDTFVNQAGISIENFRLLSEALENERYKETMKIAKRVQVALLPEKLDCTEDYDISAFSKAADEVGGDYYDTYQISPTKTAFVIGDVSGKGTSAAFNMSQMKGIFHGLVQLDLPPSEFMIRANSALSACLEKTSFITITYLVLDREKKTLEFVRAGHCPTLIFNRSTGDANYHVGKGLGLGILRNNKFGDYLETSKVSFSSGDIILLYTDGITEAMNSDREEFGEDKLKKFIKTAVDLSAEEIQDSLLKELYKFCGTDIVNDDYTMVTIKFK